MIWKRYSNLSRNSVKGGEMIMKVNSLRMMMAAVMLLTLNTACFAGKTKTITVSATVPTVSQAMNVTISKVRTSDDYWEQTSTALPIAFGTLTWNTTDYIFNATYYYAVDVGVTDNSGNVWTLTHTRASLANGSNNLDDKVNVTFMKQVDDTTATELQKVSFGNSNSVQYNKTQLAGGWLRIYYGIGTGSKDAPGVTPIGSGQATGIYNGSVTITLAP